LPPKHPVSNQFKVIQTVSNPKILKTAFRVIPVCTAYYRLLPPITAYYRQKMRDAIFPLARAYPELTGSQRHLKNVKTDTWLRSIRT